MGMVSTILGGGWGWVVGFSGRVFPASEDCLGPVYFGMSQGNAVPPCSGYEQNEVVPD
jgi:hypothetical protein